MKIGLIGAFIRNYPFGTELAFAKGLKDLGVDVYTWDPSRQELCTIPDDVDAVITFKDQGDFANGVLKVHHELGQNITIIYQPDDIRAPGIKGMMEDMLQRCDYAFTFDDSGAEYAESIGYRKARRLLVTADPDIYHPISNTYKDIDFCFIGSLSNPVLHKSRNRMIGVLRDAGHQVEALSTFNPTLINTIYNRSRVVLNHATDVGQPFGHGYGYQCRHFEAGLSGAVLLSNCLLDDEDENFGPSTFFKFWDEKSLLTTAQSILDMSVEKNALYNEIVKCHLPIHRAKEIVKFIKDARDEA